MTLSPSKFVYFNENLHCYGRFHEVTCCSRKCYVICDHNILYDMITVMSLMIKSNLYQTISVLLIISVSQSFTYNICI